MLYNVDVLNMLSFLFVVNKMVYSTSG